MNIIRLAPLFLVLAACAVETSPQVLPRVIAPGDELTIEWSPGLDRSCEDCTPRWNVDCGHEIGHPCPYLLFTTRLYIEGACPNVTGTCAVWGSATGGSDTNGVPAENLGTWNDAFELDGSALMISQRGDNGGLRHATELVPFDGGYAGDVEWSLNTEAGYTTFHVSLTFLQEAQ